MCALSLSHTRFLSLSLSLSRARSLSLSLSLCFSPSLSLSLAPSLFLSLALSLALSLSLSLSLFRRIVSSRQEGEHPLGHRGISLIFCGKNPFNFIAAERLAALAVSFFGTNKLKFICIRGKLEFSSGGCPLI